MPASPTQTAPQFDTFGDVDLTVTFNADRVRVRDGCQLILQVVYGDPSSRSPASGGSASDAPSLWSRVVRIAGRPGLAM